MKGTIRGGGERPLVYLIDGKEVTEAEFNAAFPERGFGAPGGQTSSLWPRTSEALACHPGQVAEMNERNKKAGVAVRYKPNGDPVIPDAGAWRALKRLEKVHERNGD